MEENKSPTCSLHSSLHTCRFTHSIHRLNGTRKMIYSLRCSLYTTAYDRFTNYINKSVENINNNFKGAHKFTYIVHTWFNLLVRSAVADNNISHFQVHVYYLGGLFPIITCMPQWFENEYSKTVQKVFKGNFNTCMCKHDTLIHCICNTQTQNYMYM